MNRKWMLGCVCVTFVAATNGSAADPTVTAILADWKARQTKVKTARYEITGQYERVDLAPGKPQPVNMVVLIDMEKKRVRIEKTSRTIIDEGGKEKNANPPKGKSYWDEKTILAYDGHTHYLYLPRETNTLGADNPNLFLSKGNLSSLPYHQEVWPLLEAHGIVPLAKAVPRPDKLPLDHDSDSVFDRGEIAFNGRNCTIIGSSPKAASVAMTDELYVDRVRGSSILRHVYYSDKKPWIRLDISYTDGKASWIPSGWIFTQYETSGKVVERTTYTVSRSEFDAILNNDEFIINAKSGDLLMENEYPEPGRGLRTHIPASKTSKMNENGEVETKSVTGFTTAQGQVLPPQPSSWYWWLLTIPVLIMCIGCIILFVRRRVRL